MLESVGKLADRHAATQPATVRRDAPLGSDLSNPDFNINLYMEHLQELAPKVSNRIRFLILNLLDLRRVMLP
ncbi:unnamed protein product [Gongylonema pulchrum]|uniref:Mediator of RNA polymerase II transcription subunit 7 n=1 Tax=Gongylonema pulchrum TaxID=637853 RepID=A0A183ELF2_9BILA|nr:unnamed protein product [Gongylonema pulchrum]